MYPLLTTSKTGETERSKKRVSQNLPAKTVVLIYMVNKTLD